MKPIDNAVFSLDLAVLSENSFGLSSSSARHSLKAEAGVNQRGLTKLTRAYVVAASSRRQRSMETLVVSVISTIN
jgi:hypothetical protein